MNGVKTNYLFRVAIILLPPRSFYTFRLCYRAFETFVKHEFKSYLFTSLDFEERVVSGTLIGKKMQVARNCSAELRTLLLEDQIQNVLKI